MGDDNDDSNNGVQALQLAVYARYALLPMIVTMEYRHCS